MDFIFSYRQTSKFLKDCIIIFDGNGQSIQNRKLVMFLQYIKKKNCNCFCVLLWCKTFRYFIGVQSCFLLLVFWWLWSKMGAVLTVLTMTPKSEYIYVYIYIYNIYSRQWIDGMSWFFPCWYKFGKAKRKFYKYWVVRKMAKNLLHHETQKSGVSHKWFDESSRLIE